MQLSRVTHPVEIKDFLTCDGIVVEDFVKLSQLEKENLLIVELLYLPVLLHGRCKVLPPFWWDKKSSFIIVGVTWLISVYISNVLFFQEFGTCISYFLHRARNTACSNMFSHHLVVTNLFVIFFGTLFFLYHWSFASKSTIRCSASSIRSRCLFHRRS